MLAPPSGGLSRGDFCNCQHAAIAPHHVKIRPILFAPDALVTLNVPCDKNNRDNSIKWATEYAFLMCTSAQDSCCGCRCALGAVEYHSSPFDALGAIPFAHGTIRVMRAPGATRMGRILPWCGAIAACWQLQKSPHESPPEGGASIRPHPRPQASTHYTCFTRPVISLMTPASAFARS